MVSARTVDLIYKALSDFGYPVTRDYVKSEYVRLKNKDAKPIGGPSLFIARMMEEGGQR